MEIISTSQALSYLYKLSLNQTNFRFRGQADSDWPIKPSIYRFSNFYRYQTTIFEKHILEAKPQKPNPPLTHTEFELEWLMICQHYEIPTRLLDWTSDILSALFFACYGDKEISENGALYICNQNEYPFFHNYNESLDNRQELAFVSTNVINPRMRTQSGCFMMWGHSPIDNTTETYDLLQYQQLKGNSFFLEKLIIPSRSKKQILYELESIYSISHESLYQINGYLENKYKLYFSLLKENARLMTLYMTDADQLNKIEEEKARSLFRIECRNMFGNCMNLRKS
jgi:hypothetical protein